jgi:hypothetical protein
MVGQFGGIRVRQPNWDIDRKAGADAELWAKNFIRQLYEGSVEVKAPKPFLRYWRDGFYIEYLCLRGGTWEPSGLATTKADTHLLTFGSLPGGLVIDTSWLKRAARLALKRKRHKECNRGSHPTKGVLVTFDEILETRPGEP